MVHCCAQCGAALPVERALAFCGSCGAAVAALREDAAAVERYRGVLEKFLREAADGLLEHEVQAQLATLQQRLGISSQTHARLVAEFASARHLCVEATTPKAQIRLFIDTQTLRHFAVGARCVIRLKLENLGALALDPVEIYAEVAGGQRPAPARGATVFPGHSTVLPIWLVPTMPGFLELGGVVHVVDLAGDRSYFRFSAVQFRVGDASDAARVSVVNIDQRSARVVDNSRSQFANAGPEDGRGGLVGDGDFHPVALRALSPEEAAELCPELLPTGPTAAKPPPSSAADSVQRASPLRPGASVQFTIRTEQGQYAATSILAQGDLATIYDGRRSSDGAHVVVKIADDKQDNDLIQAEVSALRLLHSEPSPQLKHLPKVLDQLHTRDGRLGTVFEYLDGFDLLQVRERLPHGLSPRHLIWLLRRSMNVLGWAHSHGVLHGNLDPAHILLRPRDHNVWLIDWCYAIINPAQTGQSFRCLNEEYSPPEVAARKPPLPSSDIYSLGKCMFYVLGGDPKSKTLPAESGGRAGELAEPIDERIQRFLQFCVLESPLSRAGDAWQAYRFLGRLREEIWGPHEFVELTL